jgi:hypothetical protein
MQMICVKLNTNPDEIKDFSLFKHSVLQWWAIFIDAKRLRDQHWQGSHLNPSREQQESSQG